MVAEARPTFANEHFEKECRETEPQLRRLKPDVDSTFLKIALEYMRLRTLLHYIRLSLAEAEFLDRMDLRDFDASLKQVYDPPGNLEQRWDRVLTNYGFLLCATEEVESLACDIEFQCELLNDARVTNRALAEVLFHRRPPHCPEEVKLWIAEAGRMFSYDLAKVAAQFWVLANVMASEYLIIDKKNRKLKVPANWPGRAKPGRRRENGPVIDFAKPLHEAGESWDAIAAKWNRENPGSKKGKSADAIRMAVTNAEKEKAVEENRKNPRKKRTK